MKSKFLKRYLVAGMICAGIAISTSVSAIASPPMAELATIDSTKQFDFVSSITGESYRIQVFIPEQPAPTGGYPSIFVLDGNALFGTFANAARAQALAREVRPAVIVGIESGTGPKSADRNLDFTPGNRSKWDKEHEPEVDPDLPTGGAEAFLQVIKTEIRPRVEQIVAVDPKQTSLFGWSLGGLFVMHTLFAHPDEFTTFIAESPSLWYNEREPFREVPAFKERVLKERLHPRLLLSVGSREGEIPEYWRDKAHATPRMAAIFHYINMVGNAQTMGATLKPYFKRVGSRMEFKVLPGETHNSAPWAIVNSALAFSQPRLVPASK